MNLFKIIFGLKLPDNCLKKMADKIEHLPVDENAPTAKEVHLIEYLFEKKKDGNTFLGGILGGFKEAILGAVLFIILSLPFLDGIIQSCIPATNNFVILLIVKTVVFLILFAIIQNIALVRS